MDSAIIYGSEYGTEQNNLLVIYCPIASSKVTQITLYAHTATTCKKPTLCLEDWIHKMNRQHDRMTPGKFQSSIGKKENT